MNAERPISRLNSRDSYFGVRVPTHETVFRRRLDRFAFDLRCTAPQPNSSSSD